MVRFIDNVRRRLAERLRAPAPTPQPAEEEQQPRDETPAPQERSIEYKPSDPEGAPSPRPRRRRRRSGDRDGADDARESATQAEPAADSARPAPEGQDNPNEIPEGDRPKRRRRRRRRRKPAEAPADAAASAAETTPEPRDAGHDEPAAEPAPPAAEPWDPTAFEVPAVEGKSRFQDFDLPQEIIHAIADLNFRYCTPIQAEVLPQVLRGGDAAGRAQTGTGKTAAFLIAIFKRIAEHPTPRDRRPGTPRALVLAPTRELVLQIENDAHLLAKYLPIRVLAVYGGMDYTRQQQQLRQGHVDLVVATPGRLMDFMQKRDINLGEAEVLVIDEADRMLDMGFIPDVRRIVRSMPPRERRQTLLFSATLTPEVTRLCAQWTQDPLTVEIEPEQVAVDTVEQIIYIVTSDQKLTLLYNLITQKELTRVIVFGNRRDETRRLAEVLARYDISCALLSGDVDQKKRVKTLDDFRDGKIRVLVATDVAGRGLHIEGISHVVNFHLPMDAEDYVHRIGRTGRAGAKGIAVSFACEEEAFEIPALESFIGRELKCVHPEEELLTPLPPPTHAAKPHKAAAARSGGRRGGGGRGGPGRSGGGGARGRSRGGRSGRTSRS